MFGIKSLKNSFLDVKLTDINKKSGSNKQASESKVFFIFHIVGKGASASGLEAFTVLLESLFVDFSFQSKQTVKSVV